MQALCGSEVTFRAPSFSILSTYSKEVFVFKGKEFGSVKVINQSIPIINRNMYSCLPFLMSSNLHLLSKRNQEMSLSELVLAVFGCYPENHFHLFPVLLQDSGNVYLPLSTKLFPQKSFDSFISLYLTSPSATFPSTTPTLYSQFLSHNPSSNSKDTIDVTPFEYFVLRFLRCIADLSIDPLSSFPLRSDSQESSKTPKTTETTQGTTAVQLFIHIMNFLIHPNSPSKPLPSNSSRSPSSQRPDFFLIAAVSELWLSRDSCLNDWNRLFQSCLSRSISMSFSVAASSDWDVDAPLALPRDAVLFVGPNSTLTSHRGVEKGRNVRVVCGANAPAVLFLREILRVC